MKKIPTLFDRDWTGDRSRVVDTPNPAADWVFRGEGVATRKLDGTSCLVRGGALFRRRELKTGQPAPDSFVTEGTDSETGKTVGWVPVGPGPEDAAHREAFERLQGTGNVADGTTSCSAPRCKATRRAMPIMPWRRTPWRRLSRTRRGPMLDWRLGWPARTSRAWCSTIPTAAWQRSSCATSA